ncbi:hypothetical protein EJ05DRAFT_283112 [Pseudovirgaria hyperparasitica]|uniref:Integral membrane protein-like protein n=1 Tax=Pseudovirgaria hyperparasitica TaxID=470096 RepID=A0A6A6WCU5_9PEZI|nr:uncharacterized protein EJ05DRAFT_283112 [Pseudovirgaria hyperparasitica]KAF2760395.1 hypothetical protein EJ05DRAFT_283112 [Pseudovirgaria hyperparasitica]
MPKLSPLVSACGMALTLNCVSNVIAQRVRAYRNSEPFVFDSTLFLQFLVVGVITTPPNYLWQGWLEKTFPGWKLVAKSDVEKGMAGADVELDEKSEKNEKGYQHKRDESFGDKVRVRDWMNIFKKWFTDCITLGAIFNTVAFLVLMGILKGKSGPQIMTDIRTETWKIIYNSYKVWPIANFVSTTWIPVEKRIVFLSFCGVLWGIYMSIVAGDL